MAWAVNQPIWCGMLTAREKIRSYTVQIQSRYKGAASLPDQHQPLDRPHHTVAWLPCKFGPHCPLYTGDVQPHSTGRYGHKYSGAARCSPTMWACCRCCITPTPRCTNPLCLVYSSSLIAGPSVHATVPTAAKCEHAPPPIDTGGGQPCNRAAMWCGCHGYSLRGEARGSANPVVSCSDATRPHRRCPTTPTGCRLVARQRSSWRGCRTSTPIRQTGAALGK
jgi:hypothetical protein